MRMADFWRYWTIAVVGFSIFGLFLSNFYDHAAAPCAPPFVFFIALSAGGALAVVFMLLGTTAAPPDKTEKGVE